MINIYIYVIFILIIFLIIYFFIKKLYNSEKFKLNANDFSKNESRSYYRSKKKYLTNHMICIKTINNIGTTSLYYDVNGNNFPNGVNLISTILPKIRNELYFWDIKSIDNIGLQKVLDDLIITKNYSIEDVNNINLYNTGIINSNCTVWNKSNSFVSTFFPSVSTKKYVTIDPDYLIGIYFYTINNKNYNCYKLIDGVDYSVPKKNNFILPNYYFIFLIKHKDNIQITEEMMIKAIKSLKVMNVNNLNL